MYVKIVFGWSYAKHNEQNYGIKLVDSVTFLCGTGSRTGYFQKESCIWERGNSDPLGDNSDLRLGQYVGTSLLNKSDVGVMGCKWDPGLSLTHVEILGCWGARF